MYEDPIAAHGDTERRRPWPISSELEVPTADDNTELVSGRDHPRSRPDLDVQGDRHARRERQQLIMGVPGPVGEAAHRVCLAMRSAQPAKASTAARILAADECHVVARRIEYSQRQEQIGIGGRRRNSQMGHCGTGDLESMVERRGPECQAVSEGSEGSAALNGVRLQGETTAGNIQIELRPPSPGERPFALGPLLEAAIDPAYLQEHRRLVCPAGVLAFEEVPEESLLEADTVVGIELHPVLQAVHLEPLLLARRAGVALEVAPGMQVVRPVRGGQHRHGDLLELGTPVQVVAVDEGVLEDRARRIGAVAAQLLLGHRFRPGRKAAGGPVQWTALADAVLNAGDLRLVPLANENVKYSAVPGEVAVEVGAALPRTDRG